MTTLWVLLHVAAQRDYELHSLDFRTAFLQGSLHEEIWLCRPPGFTGTFPAGTQCTPPASLRSPPGTSRVARHADDYTCGSWVCSFYYGPGTASSVQYVGHGARAWRTGSSQVAASVEVRASCLCRLLTHQTLLWHHHLGHPSLSCLRDMHSRLLVSGLPRSLPPLLRSLARPCLPCVKRRQHAAPHSSSFPPTSAPLQTLHMDFSFRLLEDLCGAEGIDQSFMILASPQQNGIAERRIGLVMEVARTSMIHAAAPYFLRPFAVRYAAHQLNLWPSVSHTETSPTLRWTGKVGDMSDFRFYHPSSRRVLSSRDVTFDESVRFYRLHPHRGSPVPLPPLSVVVEPPSIAPLPPPGPAPSGVSQVDPPPLVEHLEVSSDTSSPAEGGDPTAADTVALRRSARLVVPPGFPPRPSSPPLQPVAVDSGAAGGGDTGGAGFGGAGSGGAECPTGPGGAGGVAAGGVAVGGADGAGAGASGTGARRQETLSPEWLCEWAVRWGSPDGGAGRARAGGTRCTRPGGASAGVPGVGRAGGASDGGTGATGGTGGTGAVGAVAGGTNSHRQEPLLPEQIREWAVRWGSPGGGAGRTGAGGTGGTSPGGASAGVPRVRGTGGADTGGADTGGANTGGATGGTGVGGASRQESLSPQQLREWAVRWGSPGGGAGRTGSGGAVPTGARGSGGVTTQPQPSPLSHLLSLPPDATEFPVAETREPGSRASTPVRARRVARPRAPAVPGTHRTALHPSSVPQHVVLPSPPASSLPHVPDPKSDLVCTTRPTVTRLLATVVTDPSFKSAAASALVAELVDFAALCCLDYTASHVFYSSCPPSVGGELALGCDVLEDRQFDLGEPSSRCTSSHVHAPLP
ncbi:unnamed protein product [Closterium sp. NIES-54]